MVRNILRDEKRKATITENRNHPRTLTLKKNWEENSTALESLMMKKDIRREMENVLICSREEKIGKRKQSRRKICYEWKSHYFFTLILIYHPLECRKGIWIELKSLWKVNLIARHQHTQMRRKFSGKSYVRVQLASSELSLQSLSPSEIDIKIYCRFCLSTLRHFYRKSIPGGHRARSCIQIDRQSSLFWCRNVSHRWNRCSHHRRLKINRNFLVFWRHKCQMLIPTHRTANLAWYKCRCLGTSHAVTECSPRIHFWFSWSYLRLARNLLRLRLLDRSRFGRLKVEDNFLMRKDFRYSGCSFSERI